MLNRRMRQIVIIAVILIFLVVIVFLVLSSAGKNQDEESYRQAMVMIEQGNVNGAVITLKSAGNYKDAQEIVNSIENATAAQNGIVKAIKEESYDKAIAAVSKLSLKDLKYCRGSIEQAVYDKLSEKDKTVKMLDQLDFNMYSKTKTIIDIVDVSSTARGQNIIAYLSAMASVTKFKPLQDMNAFVNSSAYLQLVNGHEKATDHLFSGDWETSSAAAKSAVAKMDSALYSLGKDDYKGCKEYIECWQDITNASNDLYKAMLSGNNADREAARNHRKNAIAEEKKLMDDYNKLFKDAEATLAKAPTLK